MNHSHDIVPNFLSTGTGIGSPAYQRLCSHTLRGRLQTFQRSAIERGGVSPPHRTRRCSSETPFHRPWFVSFSPNTPFELRQTRAIEQCENKSHLKSLALEIPAERNSGSTSSSHPRRRHSPHTLQPAGPFRGFKCIEEAATAAAATSSGCRPTDENGDFKRLRSARACRLVDNIFRRFLRERGWHRRRRSVGCGALPVIENSTLCVWPTAYLRLVFLHFTVAY